MKLYYAPGACSLADHIALHEAGLAFEHEKVDLKAKKTESGADFTQINPKGYVPALTLDSGDTLTENIAILDWIARQGGKQDDAGPLGETRLLETLAFISTEIHKSFKPFFAGGSDEEKKKAGEMIHKRMGYLAETMKGEFLFGAEPSVADFYLFVMLLWAKKNDLQVPDKLLSYRERMMQRAVGEDGDAARGDCSSQARSGVARPAKARRRRRRVGASRRVGTVSRRW